MFFRYAILRSFALIAILLFISYSCAEGSCGIKPQQPPWDQQEKVVGGREATANFWPWQLTLQFARSLDPPDFRHTCGSILIDHEFALTAAHCVEPVLAGNDTNREDPDFFRLVSGAHNQTTLLGEEQILRIDRIMKHQKWKPDPTSGYPNDIALLRIATLPDLSRNSTSLVCRPLTQDANFTGNENCWVTGWGKVDFRDEWIPDVLQEAKIDVISNEECSNLNFGFIRDTHVCVGRGYPNVCSGDSGGPLNCQGADGEWYAVGIASWTIATCRGIPAVYTRISKFWEWISYTMETNRS